MKWLEVNIALNDYSRTDEVLALIVEPQMKWWAKRIDTWHFFREPEIRWRIGGNAHKIGGMKHWIHVILRAVEYDRPELFKSHWFGAHGIEGKTYGGEADYYGADVWPLLYRRWQLGSELALLKIEDKSFQIERDLHLFSNQLGLTLAEESQMLARRLKRIEVALVS